MVVPPPRHISLEASLGAISAKTMNSIVGVATSLTKVAEFGKGLYSAVTGFQSFMLSLVILVAMISVCVLFYVLLKIIRLRGFWFNHSANLADFMKNLHKDVDQTRQLYISAQATKSVYQAGGNNNLVNLLSCTKTIAYFQKYDGKAIHKNFDMFFKYYDIVRSPLDAWFHDRDFKQFSKDGEDSAAGLIVLKAKIKEIDDIRTELAKLTRNDLPKIQNILFLATVTEEDYQSGTIRHHNNASAKQMASAYVAHAKNKQLSYATFQAYTQQFIDLTIGFTVMDMYLNTYFDKLKELHNNRRFGFFNYLIYLIKPYVTTLIFNDIVNPWKEALQSRAMNKEWSDFTTAWDRLGEMIKKIPGSLAARNTRKSSTEQLQGGLETNQNEYKADFGNREDFKSDTIERFGFLKGLLSIGDFFMAILDLALGVAELLTNPFELIPYLFKIIIGFIVGIILLVLHVLGTLPPFSWMFFALYFIAFVAVPLAVGSVFYALLFALFAVISVVLWVLDLMTLGLVSKLTRCEDLPDIWHTRANFVNENLYTRALVCQSSCPSKFEPAGVFCKATNSKQPDYCPQAQVYRMYTGLPTGSPADMGDFVPDLKFWSKTVPAREQEIRTYFKKKQRFLQKCEKASARYDPLVKTICANYNTVALPKESDRPELRRVCKQIYCDGDPHEDFCYKFDGKADEKPSIPGKSFETDETLARIMKLFVMMIISVIVLLMFLHNS